MVLGYCMWYNFGELLYLVFKICWAVRRRFVEVERFEVFIRNTFKGKFVVSLNVAILGGFVVFS